jgi:uncharacterized protein YbaR (Trm112 family)
MDQRSFERRPVGILELDLCMSCHAIWFDPHESAQLTPGAVMELFRLIHEHEGDPARPLRDVLPCPVCRERLSFTRDIQRTNRISYYRCLAGHGRLTTFLQFLREKNFVRDLAPGEIEQLRARVAQVRCSSCGAMIDLARDAQCSYCRAPVSILDADAVAKTLAELDAAERKRVTVDPQAMIDGLLAGKEVERRLAKAEVGRFGPGTPSLYWTSNPRERTEYVDLVNDALDGLFE